jgi:hypothetical protein
MEFCVFIPESKLCEEKTGLIKELVANFKAKARTKWLKKKNLLYNVNQKKLYFLILVSDHQVVKIFHPLHYKKSKRQKRGIYREFI